MVVTLIAIALTLLVAGGANAEGLQNLKLLAEWKEVDYVFPSLQQRQEAIGSGKFVRGNSVPIDMDIQYRNHSASRVFVTIPRFVTGIPVTFGILSGRIGPGGPLIQAYPHYSWHESHGEDCTGLTSVFRVSIDECGRLWVLDTGRIGDNQICPPQLLAFNLNNDELIVRYQFPLTQIRPGMSLFVTPAVDVRDPPPYGNCANTMVYIADVTGFGIMVFDMQRRTSWRTQNKLVYPHPHFGTFNLAGETFDLMDGILGMALSPKIQNVNERTLFFHALASASENSVLTSILDNSTAWNANPDYQPRAFVELGVRGTQSAAQAMDRNGNLFFGLMNPNAIACWDSRTGYNRENMRVVAQNDDTLQFASGIKVVKNRNGKEELFVLTCRFQRVMTGTMSTSEVNFRIQALKISDLLGGHRCTAGGVPTSTFNFPRY